VIAIKGAGVNTGVAAAAARLPDAWADGSLDLNLLLLFLQVVNTGSISRAAVRLRVPKATLSRKLRQLEEQVGAVLLKRGPQRLEVTDIGRALHAHCERIASIATDASHVIGEMQSGVRGSIRVALPFGLASTSLSRGMVQFARRYPEVRIYAQVCNRWVDVSEESYDVAIHIGTVRNPDLPIRRLASLPRGLFAAPEYCTRRGLPQTQADLLTHDCIAMESQLQDDLWRVPVADGRMEPISPHFTTTDIVLAREVALAGVGIAMLTHALSAEDVRSGRLVRVLPDLVLPPVSISAVYLERRYLPVRIRAFIDMMAEAISGAEPPRIA
jgi:DNA-binding transcriptional LysR family regulator